MTAPIAVVLDPGLDAPQPALEKACYLARRNNTPLSLFVNARDRALEAVVGGDEARLVRARDSVMRAWEKRISSLLETFDAPQSSTSLFWERDASDMLARFVRTCAPSRVVIHAQRTSGLRRLLFTPLHWQLIHHAPCDVLCVGNDAWSAAQPVTAAIDLETGAANEQAMNQTVLAAARQLAADFSKQVALVNVVEYPDETLVMLAGDALPVTLANPQALKDFYRKRLLDFCRDEAVDATQANLLEGSPVNALADYADSHGGILVLGTGTHGALRRVLIGSTAEQVLQRVHGDVMVIKPEGFQSSWLTLPPLDAGQSTTP